MNLEFKIAETEKEKEDFFYLRWLVYGHESVDWIEKSEYEDKKETDEFDAESKYIICRDIDSGKVISGMRLTYDSEMGYPLEKYFDLDHLNLERSRTIEVGRRVTLEPDKKDSAKLNKASMGVLSMLIQLGLKGDYDTYLCAITENQFKLCQKLRCVIETEKPVEYKSISNRSKGKVYAHLAYGKVKDFPEKLIKISERFDLVNL